ncbi:hypothetical protein [Trinickia mobilis]|uniref:hypothetical protein n=1 Tax=Trinickia mobilis TaxID=2816356 RepID=UPI0035AC0EB0
MLEGDERNGPAHNNLANLLRQAGRFAQAETHDRHVLVPPARRRLAGIDRRREGRARGRGAAMIRSRRAMP